MESKLLTRVGLGVALFGIAGCAPIVWDRPNTTPAQFSMDNAKCRLTAEGMNPAAGTGTISTGHFGRDAAANAAIGLAGALVQGLGMQHDYALCMEANGYVEHQPGTQSHVASPVPLTPVAAIPIVPPAANVPVAASALAQTAPAPMPVVAAGPVQPSPARVWTRYYPPPIIVSAY